MFSVIYRFCSELQLGMCQAKQHSSSHFVQRYLFIVSKGPYNQRKYGGKRKCRGKLKQFKENQGIVYVRETNSGNFLFLQKFYESDFCVCLTMGFWNHIIRILLRKLLNATYYLTTREPLLHFIFQSMFLRAVCMES